MRSVIFYLCITFFSSFAVAEAWRFESGNNKVQLIELFTSHGCSSCPPAEKWINKYKNNSKLWNRFVPVSFHVDYWNFLGWKDPYSNASYSQRQYNHVSNSNLSYRYTPGFVVNGKEWKGFFFHHPLPLLTQSANNLSVHVVDNSLLVRYENAKSDELIVNVATLGFGLKDAIERGENEGKVLESDFVVLHFKQKPSKTGVWNVVLPESIDVQGANKLALAVWVSDLQQRPIQATGNWAPKSWLLTN